MESPFPGMDPYLEAPSLWPDVHHRLISTMAEQLQPLLSSRYTANIVPHVTLETLDITIPRLMVPDVGIVEREDSGGGGTATLTAIAAPPLVGQVALEIPTRYSRIEIRTIAGETLVTAIELLPPADKRPGADGRRRTSASGANCFAATRTCWRSICCAAASGPTWESICRMSPVSRS